METKTWAYGTRKEVVVADVVDDQCIICVENGAPEAFVLFTYKTAGIKKDDSGYIEFMEGGQTGGHWQFNRNPSMVG